MKFSQIHIDRFWARVDVKGPDECWEWKHSKNKKSYGSIFIDGKYRAAHRFSYIIHNGDIPDGMCVCHSCDNPSCVNPNHLWIGTQKDNIKDMVNKNRQGKPKGENSSNWGKKLSEETKKKISKSNSGEKHPKWGKQHSEETKEKIRMSKIGHPVSEETRLKIKNAHLGKKYSEETKQKMREKLFGNKYRLGIGDSEETKRKKSESAKIGWLKRKNKK